MKHNRFLKSIDRYITHSPWCILYNFLLLYVIYMICRAIFVLENLNMFAESLDGPLLWRMFKGGLHFDTSAICYYNIPYMLLVLLPLHYKETHLMQRVTKVIFIVVNSICIVGNLIDCVYYQFTLRRTTATVFKEFGGNHNVGSVFMAEFVNHWYLFLAAALMICFLIYAYRPCLGLYKGEKLKHYYIRQVISLIVVTLFAIMGMRGYFFMTSSRPLAMANAHEYVNTPQQTGIVLNTPFTFLRTSMTNQVKIPRFFDDEEQMASIYNPLHMPNDTVEQKRKNVVILIVESFAEEFIGERNHGLDGGTYRGYTPFVDSLMQHSLTFEHTYSNTFMSIDAMPAIISSIPKIYASFVLSPYSTAEVPSIVKELKNWGYESAFFHGAENSSMGFHAYANSAGFDKYYGRTEYDEDPNFDGEADFDGTWAIWDEEFLQFYCEKMSQMKEPFITSVFTASSHHPFAIPERYKDVYLDEGKYPLHKCIKYSDNALRRFFDSAKQQPWYENTIFVLTADHASSKITHKEYLNPIGHYRVPILFFDPSGQMQRGVYPSIFQQIDIMPTLLGYIGYDRPFVAFGQNVFDSRPEDTWSLNYHEIPQYVKGDYLIQFSDYRLSGVYNLKHDPTMDNNLIDTDDYDKAFVDEMLEEVKAILQTINTREHENNMRVSTLK